MKTTEILKQEHQVILKNLSEMVELLNQNDSSAIFEKVPFYLSFIEKYADEYHHAKEENIYFKWLLEKNPGFEHGPVGVMLHEHNIGRGLVKQAKEGLENEDVDLIKDSLFQFESLLASHIHKEDNILYMMADQINSQTQDGDEIMMPLFEESNLKLKAIAEEFEK